MSYVLIENGVVIQKQPYAQEGFIQAPDNVVCGMLFDGEEYTNPPPTEPPAPVYPTETVMQDVQTGEPVKVIVKNGQVYVGGIDDETPSE